MWGNGPYQRITEIADIHDVVVESLAPRQGDRWLDLVCGTGAVEERAAAGAHVTGFDLSRPGVSEAPLGGTPTTRTTL